MMNTHIERYVALHRSLGRKFYAQDRLLRQYASYAERLRRSAHQSPAHLRLVPISQLPERGPGQVRPPAPLFSLYAHAEDQQHEVPPAGVFGRGSDPAPRPRIIEPEQVRAIMTAALGVPPKGKISPYTYHYLFGLLAATGLRIPRLSRYNAAIWSRMASIVRNGKFGKQRLVPLQPSTRQALEAYLQPSAGARCHAAMICS